MTGAAGDPSTGPSAGPSRVPLGCSGLRVSRIGLGCSALGGVFGEVQERTAIATVLAALDASINLFDTAPAYGATRSEAVLGKALRGVERSHFVLSTKAGKWTSADGKDTFDYSEHAIRRSVDESRDRLGVDHLDIVHLHDFDYEGGRHFAQALDEGFPTLHALKSEGVIGAVGAGIYFMAAWKRVLTSVDLDVIVLHNHHTLCDIRAYELLPALGRLGIGVINAAPLASGLLTGLEPPTWHPAPASAREVLRQAAERAEELGTTLPRLALSFSASEERLPVTLFSCRSPEELRQGIEWLSEEPDPATTLAVQQVLEPIMNVQWPYGGTDPKTTFA